MESFVCFEINISLTQENMDSIFCVEVVHGKVWTTDAIYRETNAKFV